MIYFLKKINLAWIVLREWTILFHENKLIKNQHQINQLWIVTTQYQTGLIEELAKGQLQADLAKASVFWT